ncbi:MAG TPA: phosphoribosylaminoimidazolesuccinocarboxamide synthase [Gemmatimonadales bacterium]|nr:phosphoribosylaminoimidazolesuccinocarboxamide synthase [Gemmatimonadales bacterium]
MTVLMESKLPLPLLRRGKVREVYTVDAERLLLVASDRISAFDVVLREPVPSKGEVLTQISAFWFSRLAAAQPHHCITADAAEIVAAVPVLAGHRDQLQGRAMLCRRTEPVAFECVVRGYISGSAWKEYQAAGTLAGEPLPKGLRESEQLAEPIFSPATKAEVGHDENVTFGRVADALGTKRAAELRDRSLALYTEAQAFAASRGVIIADTKFEFGTAGGRLLLIDEVLTPDSSRFWPADGYRPGGPQPSFDKQPVRDYLDGLKRAGKWNGEAPAPPLPPEVVQATTDRYRDIFRRLSQGARGGH